MGCLECGKELIQTPGKRPKQFCNVTCRSNYWQKKNRAEKERGKPGRPKNTPIVTPPPERDNALINAARGRDSNGINMDEVAVANRAQKKSRGGAGDILQRIDAIRAEKIPADRNTSNGRKSWAFDQKKRIQELENQLNEL